MRPSPDFKKTPPSLRATSFFPCLRGSTPKGGWGGRTEEELVTIPEEREYFNSPSVYRGSTPKGGGSLKNDFWGHPRFLKNGRNGRVTARDIITL